MNSGKKPEPERILIRGVNWLGDAVMTTPGLRRLRERHPRAYLALLTHQKLAELWRGQSFLDSVLTFESGESPWTIGRRLRAGQFDAAVVFPNSPRSALEVWAAGIPRRIGQGGGWRSWFLNEVVPRPPEEMAMRKRSVREIKRLVAGPAPAFDPSRSLENSERVHQTNHYLRLAGALGASTEPIRPALEISSAETAAAHARWMAKCGPIVLAVNPGAAYGPAKRWPAENFSEVIRQVALAVRGVCWVAIGTREERGLCSALQTSSGAQLLNLAGETTLRELMAVLSSCKVLLTNDSGPMHVAAALGTPVVVPFGSTSADLTGPGLPGDIAHALLRGDAACSPCFRRECPIDFRCMKSISTGQVTGAVLKILERTNARASEAPGSFTRSPAQD